MFYTGQSLLAGTSVLVKKESILLEQSFTVRMPNYDKKKHSLPCA